MESKLQDFLDRLAEVLEVPEVALEDDFRQVPMWSSLTGFAVMVMFDIEFGRGLSVTELKDAKNVADLARLVGVLS